MLTSPFSIQQWGSILNTPEDIPEDTHTLTLEKSRGPMDELHRLFAAVPQLTHLTFRHRTNENGKLDWGQVGKALLKTPHVNYLNCRKCELADFELLEILKGCTLELCELNLSHNRLLFNNKELIRRLQYFTNLRTVDVQHNFIWFKRDSVYNSIIEASATWVQLSSLNLSLSPVVGIIYGAGSTTLHQHFETILPKMTALTELHMKGLSTQCSNISGVLAALPTQLEVLDLYLNDLIISPSFCEVLSRMTALRELDISYCYLNDQRVILLTPCLANCHALTSLCMNRLALKSEVAVSSLVRGLTQLQLLHLGSCHLEDLQVAALVRSLYYHRHLTSLNLSNNILADESGHALADWPQLLCLEEVGLSKPENKPGSETSVVEEALQQSLCFRRIVTHMEKPASEISLQQATREACQRNTVRHATLLSICDDPKRVMGSIEVCGSSISITCEEYFVHPNRLLPDLNVLPQSSVLDEADGDMETDEGTTVNRKEEASDDMETDEGWKRTGGHGLIHNSLLSL